MNFIYWKKTCVCVCVCVCVEERGLCSAFSPCVCVCMEKTTKHTKLRVFRTKPNACFRMAAQPILKLRFTNLHSSFSQIQTSCNLLSDRVKSANSVFGIVDKIYHLHFCKLQFSVIRFMVYLGRDNFPWTTHPLIKI